MVGWCWTFCLISSLNISSPCTEAPALSHHSLQRIRSKARDRALSGREDSWCAHRTLYWIPISCWLISWLSQIVFNGIYFNMYLMHLVSHVVEELWIRLSVLDAMHCHHSANSKLLQASSTLSELTHLMYHRNDFHRRISETGLQWSSQSTTVFFLDSGRD